MTNSGDDVDPRAVLRHLGWEATEPPERIEGGWDTLLYRFATADGRLHALRVFRREDANESIGREVAGLKFAAESGLPVQDLEASGEWEGRPVLVLSWSPGKQVVDAVQSRPWGLWAVAKDFGKVQARLNALPAPEVMRPGAPDYWLQWAADEALAERLVAEGLVTDRLIHLDYHPLNVLSDGSCVTAVLDWTNAAAGDPRADFARMSAIVLTAPVPPGPLRPVLGALRRLFYWGCKSGYEEEAGPLGDLAPFMAWAGTTALNDYEEAISEGRGWAKPKDLERARRWVAAWREKAGLGA